jgi:hypothetical protein
MIKVVGGDGISLYPGVGRFGIGAQEALRVWRWKRENRGRSLLLKLN